MSESILKALMQLFAIIACPDSDEKNRRPLVFDFLKHQLNQKLVDEYLIVFDNYYHKHQKRQNRKKRKRLASSSVRVLSICTLINKELTHRQKIIVVIRLLEFIDSESNTTKQELEFVETVSEIFMIQKNDFYEIRSFIFESNNNIPDIKNILIINNEKINKYKTIKHLFLSSLDCPVIVYQNRTANMYIFVYRGDKELYINGLLIQKNRVYLMSAGSAIRSAKRHPIYYSDIVSAFNEAALKTKIIFEAKNITYKFKNNVKGIRKTSFTEKSGKLIGIMGGSGSGKSTLLGVLNGTFTPTNGSVKINGFDVHKDKKQIEGIIGHVSQDDLLIEELTVFQNIYYNAKLCFEGYSKFQLLSKVIAVLKSMGLYEIKHMKVGSPLNRKISGGQRKRLNIALEFIREPSVLFLDEPTSGLSSRDSRHILDLLKELSLKGKLIFVVIHQPSSDIFKMFDRLMIIDKGGYFVYDGNPVDSIVYFRSYIKQVAPRSESECTLCGNVNSEQIFDILESPVLDEYGNITSTRKISPYEWNKYFKTKKTEPEKIETNKKLPKILFKIPNRFKQFCIFAKRDITSKFANKQYLLINLLEAPFLAFMLSYIIKFHAVGNNLSYTISQNDNLPVYIFMSVIIALFIGMTISATEIIKDRKIQKRESFLNLSRTSYLFSKISVLFALAAYQALIYVLIGNLILEIKGMFVEYWIVLFSSWIFAVMLGLNISDGFKTSVTIYIIIPFLIIPQIVLSGIIVRYENLNPEIVVPNKIPWFGEIITARWAYEALAVDQFVNNDYQKPIYKYKRKKHHANYKKDIWLNELNNRFNYYLRNKDDKEKKSEIISNLEVLRNEINKEVLKNKKIKSNINIENLFIDKINKNDIINVKKYFDDIKNYYIKIFNYNDNKEEEYVNKQTKTEDLEKKYSILKSKYHNKSLEDFVTNAKELNSIIEFEANLYRKVDMIYKYPDGFIKAHFYAPKKRIFGKYYDTIYVNTGIIWLFVVLLYITLYFSVLKKSLNFIDYIKMRFNKK